MVVSRLLGGEMVWWRYDRKRCKNSHIGYSTTLVSHFLGHVFAATELLRRELSCFQDFGRMKTQRDHFLFLLTFVLGCGPWELNFRKSSSQNSEVCSSLILSFPTLLPRFAHTLRAPRVVLAGQLVGKSIAIFFVLLTHQNSIVSTLGWLLGAICRVPFAFFWGAAGRYWDTFFNWSPAG